MPTAVITVKDVKDGPSGTKNGRPWQIYRVIDDSGREYSTFESAWQSRVGQQHPIEYTEEDRPGKDGRMYKRRMIVEPKKEKAREQETFSTLYQVGQVMETLKRLEAKVDEILAYCRNEPEKDVPF